MVSALWKRPGCSAAGAAEQGAQGKRRVGRTQLVPLRKRDGEKCNRPAYQPEPNTNPIDRSTGLKAVPKNGEVMLFWMSRSAADPNTL